jgi:SHAQKYF class myb-like DNA-binding protein
MAKINMGKWTQAERTQFEKGVVQFGWGNWVEITEGISSRRKSQVKSHAQKFALHRPEEYAKLIDKHNKMEAIKKKKKVDGERVSSPKAASRSCEKKLLPRR